VKAADGHDILYVDDEPRNLYLFRSHFGKAHRVHTARSGAEALEIFARTPIHLLLADQRMPQMSGIELLERVSREYPEAIRMLITGYADIDVVIDAINRGAVYRYLSKPWDVDELSAAIRDALELYELRARNRSLLASLNEQNRLLSRKNRELGFLNELSQELQELREPPEIIATAIERLRAELHAERGLHCEEDGELQIRWPVPAPEESRALLPAVERLIAGGKEEPVAGLPGSGLEGGPALCVLPLAFREASFGYLILAGLQGGCPQGEELRFARTAAQLVSSVLYGQQTHREELKREQLMILGQMASMVVHDLKGPLATILGFVGLLQADLGRREREEFAGIINEEVRRLIEMVEELLSFARGEAHLSLSAVHLPSFLQEVLELFRVSFRQENIQTEVGLDGVETIQADRRKLKKVFINLLQNAREHLHGVKGERRVEIHSTQAQGGLIISFINNGPVIPAELQGRLFEPFFSYGKERGTGLGLTICRKIVEEHRGELTAHCEPGRNEFRICLPVAQSSAPGR
jgi:signal transduction histidine kinase/CheY-like chemotaxis protein